MPGDWKPKLLDENNANCVCSGQDAQAQISQLNANANGRGKLFNVKGTIAIQGIRISAKDRKTEKFL